MAKIQREELTGCGTMPAVPVPSGQNCQWQRETEKMTYTLDANPLIQAYYLICSIVESSCRRAPLSYRKVSVILLPQRGLPYPGRRIGRQIGFQKKAAESGRQHE
jgi:hypothetical protein